MKKPIVLAALLALAACADSPAESFAKAQAEFAANDYTAARIHLAAALAKEPGNRAMLLLQARNFVALGDGFGAGTALDKLSGGKPHSGELAELAAEAALLRRAPDAVAKLLGSAKSAEAERLRALAALQKSDTATAEKQFEKAVAAGGSDRVYADYARYRLMIGDIEGADKLAALATKTNPDSIDTLLINGQLKLRRGDLASSLTYFEQAEKRYPANLAARVGRAGVLGDLGRIEEMDQAIARASALAPRDPSVIYLKVKSAAARKDWGGVRAALQPVEAGLGQLDPMRQLYAEALMRMGQPEQAAAQLQPIVRAMPANREARRLMGEAQLIGGDARAALATLAPLADHPAARTDELQLAAKAAKAAKDPAAARYEARARQPAAQALGRDLADGDTAMRAGNWGGAVQAYDRVLAVTDDRNVLVLNNIAYAHTMLGHYDKAIDYARRALKEAPNNPSVLDTAGWAMFKSGKDIEQARRLLRRAAELAPKNATIRAHLAEAERAPT